MSAGYSAISGGFGVNPSVTATLMNFITVANMIGRVNEWSVSTDGVTPLAIPAIVDFCKSTQATAGTSTNTPVITQTRGETRPALAVPLSKYTAEPTVLTAVKTWYLPEFAGSILQQYPLGREPSLAGVGGYAVRVTTSATTGLTNFRGHFEWEEG